MAKRKSLAPNDFLKKVQQAQQMNTPAKVPQCQSSNSNEPASAKKVVIITPSNQAYPQAPNQNSVPIANFKLQCPNCDTPYSLEAHLPITICKSGEMVCLQCSDKFQASKKMCPFCESHLVKADQFPPNKFAIQVLELLEGKRPQNINLISRNLMKIRETMTESIFQIEALIDNAKGFLSLKGINKNFMNLEGNKHNEVEMGEAVLKVSKNFKLELEEALQKAKAQLVDKKLELENQ